MTKQQLLKLIRESRPLLKTASPEQKVKLLALIRESYKQVKQSQLPYILIENEELEDKNADYLEEK